MKKIALFTSMLLLIFTSIHSQVIESVGFKAGISLANQTWKYKSVSNETVYDYKSGFCGILSAELLKSRYLSFTSDLGYFQKGMQYKVLNTSPEFPEGDGTYTTYKSSYQYLSLSPMLKAFYNLNNFGFYALLGPRVDYRLAYQSDDTDMVLGESKKGILGLTYGGGVEYQLDRVGILLEFQGQPDFTGIIDTEPSEDSTGLKITGNAFTITTGISFKLH